MKTPPARTSGLVIRNGRHAAARSYRWCSPLASGNSTTPPNCGPWTSRASGASPVNDRWQGSGRSSSTNSRTLCQAQVEMSAFRPSRNVRFCEGRRPDPSCHVAAGLRRQLESTSNRVRSAHRDPRGSPPERTGLGARDAGGAVAAGTVCARASGARHRMRYWAPDARPRASVGPWRAYHGRRSARTSSTSAARTSP